MSRATGVVVCFDELGPIQLIPHQGSGWAPAKRPERLRATFKRPHGVRYPLGAYDVHEDRLEGELRTHKNAGEVLDCFGQLRLRYGRIECPLWAIDEVVINNADYPELLVAGVRRSEDLAEPVRQLGRRQLRSGRRGPRRARYARTCRCGSRSRGG